MSTKILLVDDDPNLLASFERNLRRQFTLDTAQGAEAALAALSRQGPYAVVVADRQMPGMDGIQLLSTIRERAPDTVRIMLTGNADLEGTIRVVNEGNIFRFLTKPCPLDTLSKALSDALSQYSLVTAEKELLNRTLGGSIKLLTDILSMVDPQSFGRAQLLRETIASLMAKLNLNAPWEVHLAIMLAPIGLLTVPPAILVKSRSGETLSPTEEQMLASVPETAARLLANIPRLEGVARVIRYQQNDFGGSGFLEDSLCGEALPLGSRLLRILLDMLELQAKGNTQIQALDQMQTREGCYDPALLLSVRTGLTGSTAAAPPPPRPPISVTAKNLARGMVLRSNITSKDGMLILSAGHQITDVALEKIRNFQLVAGIAEPILVDGSEPGTPWR